MAYVNLKAAIKQAIKQNGNQEITGNLLQSTLLSIVNTIEDEHNKFLGFANSSTESDLDISDEYGNVLVRFASGHIKVKNFDSADINESISAILSNIGFDNITEFSEEEDYDIGEIVRYGKLVYVFTSAHKAGEWDVSDVKETVITTEHPIEVSDKVSEADLDISDEHGNVIMRLKDGHIQTQKFNSLTSAGGGKITYSIIKNL